MPSAAVDGAAARRCSAAGLAGVRATGARPAQRVFIVSARPAHGIQLASASLMIALDCAEVALCARCSVSTVRVGPEHWQSIAAHITRHLCHAVAFTPLSYSPAATAAAAPALLLLVCGRVETGDDADAELLRAGLCRLPAPSNDSDIAIHGAKGPSAADRSESAGRRGGDARRQRNEAMRDAHTVCVAVCS